VTEYTGWYPDLIFSQEDCIDLKMETSCFFTGVPDDMDNGGNLHLGNGPSQLLYCVYRDKVFIGPVYQTYQFMTNYEKMYTDEDWECEILKYKPFQFN
jgi:hypothetical protein